MGKRLPETTDKELWSSRMLTDAVLHPDTKEPVPAMFRVRPSPSGSTAK